jgi:hypothetical protein
VFAAKRCFGDALLHIPCLLESILVFITVDAIGGEVDAECSLADGGVDIRWMVARVSGALPAVS